MASKFNWALIREGSTFQSLVNALLSFESPSVRLFGRSGKDGAQDAISADGKIVFQDKFHINPSISKTIGDALREKEKIEKYRQSGDKRETLWKAVIHWILVTNVEINPNDAQRWEKEVVPEFQALGLIAELWSRENLEELLIKYPHVAEAYFEGKNRCFLSFPEAIAFVQASDVAEAASEIPLIGREGALNAVRTFLKGTDRILCLHGAGGIGKTRVLTEAGLMAQEEGFQVLWGLESTMMKTPNWFTSIGLAQETLLLIDEPRDPTLIRILSEQMNSPTSQMKNWKVAISLRSPRDPVMLAIEQLKGSLKANSFALSPLTPEEAQSMALHMLEKKGIFGSNEEAKRTLAANLSRLADRFPVWIVLAVNVYSKGQSLSENPTVVDIASSYVDEAIQHSPERLASKEQFQTIIRWLALYGEIDTDDAALTQHVALEAGMGENVPKLQECLRYLSTRKFAARRGLKQTRYSITPDVITDFVLRTWLLETIDDRLQPTEAATSLVKQIVVGRSGKVIPKPEIIIGSLARVEMSEKIKGQTLDLLSPLVIKVQEIAHTGGLNEVHGVLPLTSRFAFARVMDVAEVSRLVRTNARPSITGENAFGEFVVTHADVVKELPWLLYEASKYAFHPDERKTLFKELEELAIFEGNNPQIVVNDGKSATALIERLASDSENSPVSFELEGFASATALLSRLSSEKKASSNAIRLLPLLCQPHLSIERRSTTFDRHKFTIRSWNIGLQTNAGRRRATLRTSLRNLVSKPLEDAALASVCWSLLSEAHASANRQILGGKQGNEKHIAEIREDLLDDMTWALATIASEQFSLVELRSARRIWDWHRRYDEDKELKALAESCEAIYQSHPLVKAFQTFFELEFHAEVPAKAAELVASFAGDIERKVMSFLEQAVVYAPNADYNGIFEVADSLASKWDEAADVKSFLIAALKEDPSSVKFRFGCRLLNSRLKRLRETSQGAIAPLLEEVIAIPPTEEGKAELLHQLYSRPHPLLAGLCTASDFAFVRSSFQTIKLERRLQCQVLAGFFHVDWEQCKSDCEALFQQADLSEKPSLFFAIMEGISFLGLFAREYAQLSVTSAQTEWLLELLIQLPDIDAVSENLMWRIDHFADKQSIQTKSIAWLNQTIVHRIALTEKDTTGTFKLVPTQNELTRFVLPINGPADEASKQELETLLANNSRKDLLGFALPAYAASVDPTGTIVPQLVAAKINGLESPSTESLWLWSRFAGHYELNSEAWRKIAIAAISASQNLSVKDQASIFVSILDHGVRSSSYPADEMDPRPLQELEQRKKELETEPDPTLKMFREWALRVAQARYDQASAEFEEDSVE